MRYVNIGLLLLASATALLAADPFVGTWKLNSAKSKYKAGAPPRDQTIVISEKGGDLDINITGTAADGSPIANHYTIPLKGGAGKIVKSPYDAVAGKRPSDNKRIVTYSKGGKVVYTADPTVSADGKTMTAAAKGTSLSGQPVEGTVVYDKQ